MFVLSAVLAIHHEKKSARVVPDQHEVCCFGSWRFVLSKVSFDFSLTLSPGASGSWPNNLAKIRVYFLLEHNVVKDGQFCNGEICSYQPT